MATTLTFTRKEQQLTSCRVAATSNLAGNYSNGQEGVGATLTNSGALAALVIDGITLVAGERVLLAAQTSDYENGLYSVTNSGSSTEAWVLTRSVDFHNVGQMQLGYFVPVENGTANKGIIFVVTAVPGIIGTDTITFTNATSDADLGQAAFKAVTDDAKSTVVSLDATPVLPNEIALVSAAGSLVPSGTPIKLLKTSFGGGGTTHVVAATGVTSTYNVLATLNTATTLTAILAEPQTDQIRIEFAADPGAGTTVTIAYFAAGI